MTRMDSPGHFYQCLCFFRSCSHSWKAGFTPAAGVSAIISWESTRCQSAFYARRWYSKTLNWIELELLCCFDLSFQDEVLHVCLPLRILPCINVLFSFKYSIGYNANSRGWWDAWAGKGTWCQAWGYELSSIPDGGRRGLTSASSASCPLIFTHMPWYVVSLHPCPPSLQMNRK